MLLSTPAICPVTTCQATAASRGVLVHGATTGLAQQRSVLHGVASGHTDTVCTLCNVPSSATSHHSQLLPSDCIDIEAGLKLAL